MRRESASRSAILIASAAAATIAASTVAQPTFQGLGFLTPRNYSEGWGISGDGNVPVGGSIVAGSGIVQIYDAFRHNESGLSSVYGDGAASSVAFAASFDGSAIVGKADYGAFSPMGIQAFIWTPSGGPVLLGDLDYPAGDVPRSYGRGISSDGRVVAGIGHTVRGTEAFRWTQETGMQPLGDIPGGTFASYAYGISRDGNVIVGISFSDIGQEAFRWTMPTPNGGGMVRMGFLPGSINNRNSACEAANDDGSIIVGESSTPNAVNGNEAFRWTAATGMVPLGDLPGGGFQSWAYSVSGDGSIVVGRGSIAGACGPFGCGSAGRAFIWDAQHGMRDLQQVLIDAGVNLTGWALTEARAVSRDGRAIVGTGFNPAGQIEAWVARLPPPRCIADVDDGSSTGTPDGAVTLDDLLFYLDLFDRGDARADIDNGSGTGTPDGGVTIDDLLYFLVRFESGC